MPEYEAQNICIVLDASRSMFRTDYNPNRFEACKEAILNLVRMRMADDTKTGFALVYFGKEVKKLIDFDDYSDAEKFRELMDSIEIGGPSKLSDAIGLAIKLHIEDIRKAGAKAPHILVFSDGKLTPSKVGPTKMAEIARGLEIKIDTVRLGEVEHFNIMKRISELTDGKYYYCHDAQSIMVAAADIAESNKGKKYSKSKNLSAILEKIAVPLKTAMELARDAAELAEKIRGKASYNKCGICFMEDDPITKAPFTIAGRYCPNCGQGYHIHCIAQWAAQDKDSNGRVTRCPHCFYLIKIPAEVQQAAKIREDYRKMQQQMEDSGPDSFYAKAYRAAELGDDALYGACPVCNSIFDEDEEVIKCGNPECTAIYHKDCFEQYMENQPCKMCGKKMVRSF